jgi:arginase family enzyme
MRLQILDLDGSLQSQSSLRDAAPWSSVTTVDLRDLGPKVRLWSRDETMRRVRERLPARDEPTLSLLGSGDFHHVAVLLMETSTTPMTIIHIDNHPDWVRLAPRWHCGSWVNQALRLPNVAKVITLGPCSDDLVKPGVKGGNMPALASGKIVLFPWNHAPSRLYRQILDGAGHRYDHGFLIWRNLAETDLEESLARILSLIETNAVWFSIDKDVLPESEALTNWDQGQMPLAAVKKTIETIGAHKRIIGADICGEFSPARHSNWFKRWEAKMDQPQRADDAGLLARSESINRELLAALEKVSR